MSPTSMGDIPSLPNLTALSLNGLRDLFTSFSSYNALQIKGALHSLTGAALAKGNGSFAIDTPTFSLQSKVLSATEPLLLPNISLPPLGLAPGSFVSRIQWTTNPYDQSSNPVVSLSALGSDSSELSIRSLSTPFTTAWPVTAPNYTFFCERDLVLLGSGSSFTVPALNKVGSAWMIPCGDSFVNVSCPIQSFQCPSTECVYWNTSLSSWQSDGCVTERNGSMIYCHCTHMTDFSTRIKGIVSKNADVFSMASSVYSEEGLRKFSSWYGIFGSFALATCILIYIATRLDYPLRPIYVDILMKHDKFKPILARIPYTPIYRYNPYSSAKLYKKRDDTLPPPKSRFNPCRRLCIQHSYFQAILRFDPRLSRSFRTLFLILIQFHSLFITAFLYGFSNGSKVMSAGETIVLALLTALVTIPCVRLALWALNRVGLEEFKFQFPAIYHEYMRRVEFEAIAEPLFSEEKGKVEDADVGESVGISMDESLCVRMLNLCQWRSEAEVEVKPPKERTVILRELAECIKKEYPKFRTYGMVWERLPCHTVEGWIFLLSSLGWIGWCLNYLLLFASAHSTAVGEGILISYGSTELVTIFLTQPLTIICTMLVFIFGHKKLPWPFNTESKSVPSIYYFSNPLHSHSILSSEFAHILFLDVPAHASGVDILSLAPIKSIVPTIHNEEEEEDRRIEQLYHSMLKYYTEALV